MVSQSQSTETTSSKISTNTQSNNTSTITSISNSISSSPSRKDFQSATQNPKNKKRGNAHSLITSESKQPTTKVKKNVSIGDLNINNSTKEALREEGSDPVSSLKN